MTAKTARPAVEEAAAPVPLTREQAARLKWRGELDVLPPVEIVIPAENVKRKSAFYVAECDDLITRDNAFELLKGAIKECLGER